jgi:hypothetical protein
MERSTNNPITVNPANSTSIRTVFAGQGYMSQLSYLLKSNIEIAGRYAATQPAKTLYENLTYPALNERKTETVELVLTKYIVAHRLKIQSGIMHTTISEMKSPLNTTQFWSGSFQIELGI